MKVVIDICRDLPDEQESLTIILYTKSYLDTINGRNGIYEYKSTAPKDPIILVKVIEGAVNYLLNQHHLDITRYMENLIKKKEPVMDNFMKIISDKSH
jgi:hypothetical protein